MDWKEYGELGLRNLFIGEVVTLHIDSEILDD